MHLRLIVGLSIALMSSGCSLLPLPEPRMPPACDPQQQPCDEAWVRVMGPEGWPPADYILEAGVHGWRVDEGQGGGVAAVPLSEGERVSIRLVQPQTCEVAVEFPALPGSYWVVRFAADGTPTVEDWTGRSRELGPGLMERQRSDCPGSGR